MDVQPQDVLQWHRDFGWKKPGYADFIDRAGNVHNLNPYNEDGFVSSDEITNGVKGYNDCSRHVCLAGGLSVGGQPENNFTDAQFNTLAQYVRDFLALHPDCEVRGHNEFAAKACPCFSVPEFLRNYVFV